MDQITLIEQELLELGVPASVPAEDLHFKAGHWPLLWR